MQPGWIEGRDDMLPAPLPVKKSFQVGPLALTQLKDCGQMFCCSQWKQYAAWVINEQMLDRFYGIS